MRQMIATIFMGRTPAIEMLRLAACEPEDSSDFVTAARFDVVTSMVIRNICGVACWLGEPIGSSV